jgi:hypothetical protein
LKAHYKITFRAKPRKAKVKAAPSAADRAAARAAAQAAVVAQGAAMVAFTAPVERAMRAAGRGQALHTTWGAVRVLPSVPAGKPRRRGGFVRLGL